MSDTLYHLEGQLWFCDELGRTGTIAILNNGDIQFEYRNDNGHPALKRWRPRDVQLISTQENPYLDDDYRSTSALN